MSNDAYQITEDDVENVLRSNSLVVANTMGKSFESIANEIFGNLDCDLIEQAALFGDDLDEQTDYANDEIARQLRGLGILEPLKDVVPNGIGCALTKEAFLALQAEAEDLELAHASGQDLPEHESRLKVIDRLMNEGPWTLHPDYGCVLKSKVNAMDLAAMQSS